jgi:hypothetical protein
MPYKKESLEKLLLLIDVISKENGNEWFRNKLNSQFCINNNLAGNSAINEIYEYCIKHIIKEQAEKFYHDFKISPLRKQLIDDFIRMENFKRMDNFEDFSLAVYQQIENIIIYLFSNKSFQTKLLKDIDTPAFHVFNKDSSGIYIKDDTGKNITIRSGKFKVSNLLIQSNSNDIIKAEYNKDLETWAFNRKLRAVVYYYYFNSYLLSNNQKELETICENANEIYQMRNLNHRGNLKSEKQKKIIDTILTRHSNYYFKFLGFLEDFTSMININY